MNDTESIIEGKADFTPAEEHRKSFENNAIQFGALYTNFIDYLGGDSPVLFDPNNWQFSPRVQRVLLETSKDLELQLEDNHQSFELYKKAITKEKYPELNFIWHYIEDKKRDIGEAFDISSLAMSMYLFERGLKYPLSEVQWNIIDASQGTLSELREGVYVFEVPPAAYYIMMGGKGVGTFMRPGLDPMMPGVIVSEGKAPPERVDHELQHVAVSLLSKASVLPHGGYESYIVNDFNVFRNEAASYVIGSRKILAETKEHRTPLKLSAGYFYETYFEDRKWSTSEDTLKRSYQVVEACALICDRIGLDRNALLYGIWSSGDFETLTKRVIQKTFAGINKGALNNAFNSLSLDSEILNIVQDYIKK